MNYQTAENKLGSRESRKIDNNTYLKRRAPDTIAVMLHKTDILTFKPDGSTIYNSGGWRTSTTKARMNEYGSARITQKAGQWYICGNIYADGCAYKDGEVIGALPPDADKEHKKLLKDAKTYARGFMEAFFAGKVPAPSAGDCWSCLFRKSDGNCSMGNDHILQHFAEKYYVPSLLVAACEAFPISPLAKNAFAYMWNPAACNNEKMPEFVRNIADAQMYSSLYRFIKRQLNIAA